MTKEQEAETVWRVLGDRHRYRRMVRESGYPEFWETDADGNGYWISANGTVMGKSALSEEEIQHSPRFERVP